MEIKCRNVCLVCKGTGRNDISDFEALEMANQRRMEFPGGVLAPGSLSPPPIEWDIAELQKCPHCDSGYIVCWCSLYEVLTRGDE